MVINKFVDINLRYLSLITTLITVFLISNFSISRAQEFPNTPNRLVSDYTNTLTSEQIKHLEQKLVMFSDSTSNQIAVVLIKSTGRYDIADYTVRLAKKWGVGDKKYNNGIVLLAALGDRAITIQTGYGLEGAVPDIVAYRIIENEIKPAFREGNYYLGLDRATDALISYTKGEYKADPRKNVKRKSSGIPNILGLIAIIIIIIILTNKGGKGGGGRGEIVGGKGSSDLLWWALLNEMGRSSRGNNRGGGFGGGGFGGGGFGGFGGGGFGGGGASGRW